jgi:hypothetical protein
MVISSTEKRSNSDGSAAKTCESLDYLGFAPLLRQVNRPTLNCRQGTLNRQNSEQYRFPRASVINMSESSFLRLKWGPVLHFGYAHRYFPSLFSMCSLTQRGPFCKSSNAWLVESKSQLRSVSVQRISDSMYASGHSVYFGTSTHPFSNTEKAALAFASSSEPVADIGIRGTSVARRSEMIVGHYLYP